MRILSVVIHSCIRSHKISWGLMQKGHSVHLVTEQPLDVHGWVDFNSCNLIHTGQLNGTEHFPDQFHATIQALAPTTDLVYFSNEPDWPVEIIHDAAPEIPIVYDIHDMVSQRTGSIGEDQKKAEELAEAFMVPSREYQRIILSRHAKPCAEILSCVPKELFPGVRRRPHRRGLVREGGLKGKSLKQFSDQFEFRSWAEAFKELSKLNVEVWCYPATVNEDFKDYERSGVMMMPPLRYDELLKNLTAHEAGLVGSPYPSGAFDGAMPNKLFEYIAAGIPVVALNAPTVSEFLAATGFGYTARTIYDIPAILERIRDERIGDRMWDERHHWNSEKQVDKVEKLFHEVLHA